MSYPTIASSIFTDEGEDVSLLPDTSDNIISYVNIAIVIIIKKSTSNVSL